MTTFLTEIYEQPDAIANTATSVQQQLEGLHPLLDRIYTDDLRRIVFTGMGSSFSCVYPSLLRLTEKGVDVRMVEAAELLHYQSHLLNAQTLLVVISQSGRSVEVPSLLELAQETNSPVLGITNTSGSPLHLDSDAALLTLAGEEATVSTKTYTVTLAALHLLTSFLLKEDMNAAVVDLCQLAEAIRTHLHTWQTHMAGLASEWRDTPFVEFLARGHSFASASTAALIFKESVKIPAEGMNAGQFRHGPIELVDERFTGFMFLGGEATRELNLALANNITQYGGRLALVSHEALALEGTHSIPLPPCDASLLPLVEIIPIQFFCGEMAIQHGYQAGYFRYSNKVTTHE